MDRSVSLVLDINRQEAIELAPAASQRNPKMN
jgi:hypothetical protein